MVPAGIGVRQNLSHIPAHRRDLGTKTRNSIASRSLGEGRKVRNE